jgi:tripartite-type tricarboxylate transporter receptor subunit TctC
MGWGGLLVPKGTPPAVLGRLQQACAAAVTGPEMHAMLTQLQTPQGYLPSSDFEAFVRVEHDRYGRLIRASEISDK